MRSDRYKDEPVKKKKRGPLKAEGTDQSYNIFKWYSIISDTIKLCKV